MKNAEFIKTVNGYDIYKILRAVPSLKTYLVTKDDIIKASFNTQAEAESWSASH